MKNVSNEIVIADRYGAVIARFVRIADLDDVRIELPERFSLRCGAHPVQTLDAHAIGRLEVVDQGHDLGLGRRREVLGGIQLAHGPAKIAECIEVIAAEVVAAGDGMHATLPARL